MSSKILKSEHVTSTLWLITLSPLWFLTSLRVLIFRSVWINISFSGYAWNCFRLRFSVLSPLRLTSSVFFLRQLSEALLNHLLQSVILGLVWFNLHLTARIWAFKIVFIISAIFHVFGHLLNHKVLRIFLYLRWLRIGLSLYGLLIGLYKVKGLRTARASGRGWGSRAPGTRRGSRARRGWGSRAPGTWRRGSPGTLSGTLPGTSPRLPRTSPGTSASPRWSGLQLCSWYFQELFLSSYFQELFLSIFLFIEIRLELCIFFIEIRLLFTLCYFIFLFTLCYFIFLFWCCVCMCG